MEDTIDYDFYNYRLHKMARLSSIRNSTTEDIANAKRGDHWMDCTAGAFRDFNAAAHLLKHSPLTKIIMIVRDPWQVRLRACHTSNLIANNFRLV